MLTILSFFFVLSLLVVVHEFGHYIVAKLGGIGVERFSVGYPPRLFGIKIGETDYCISAIPFGGYVKLTGQDDFAKEEEANGNPRDFRSKPAALRVAVLMAGSLMNIAAAIAIFAVLYSLYGVPITSNVVGYIEPGSLAATMGIAPGDTLTTINGAKVAQFDETLLPLYTDKGVKLSLRTASGERTLTAPRLLGQQEEFGVGPLYKALVGTVAAGGSAEKAGIKPHDLIVAVNDTAVTGWYHMSSIIRANPGQTIPITIQRGATKLDMIATVDSIDESNAAGDTVTVGRLGVSLEVPVKEVGPIEAVGMAAGNTAFLASHMLDFFGKLVTGRMSSKLLGGPVMIAQMAGESARSGFSTLMGFTAFISINLGVLNLLPFPVLDGGHVTIILIESVIRRKVSERITFALQQAGTIFLLLLMLYITFNDIMRFDAIARFFGGG